MQTLSVRTFRRKRGASRQDASAASPTELTLNTWHWKRRTDVAQACLATKQQIHTANLKSQRMLTGEPSGVPGASDGIYFAFDEIANTGVFACFTLITSNSGRPPTSSICFCRVPDPGCHLESKKGRRQSPRKCHIILKSLPCRIRPGSPLNRPALTCLPGEILSPPISCKGNGMHSPQEMGTSESSLPSTFSFLRIPDSRGLGVYVVWALHLL